MTDPRDRHRARTWEQRGGDRCPRCGRPYESADRADVHHRDGNEHNGDPDNLRKRCRRCHLGAEHDRPDDVDSPQQPAGPGRTRPTRPRTGPRGS